MASIALQGREQKRERASEQENEGVRERELREIRMKHSLQGLQNVLKSAKNNCNMNINITLMSKLGDAMFSFSFSNQVSFSLAGAKSLF